jgi:hypothetical protein
MRTLTFLIAISLTSLVVGCGGKSGAAPTPTPGNIVMGGQDGTLFLGETYAFSMSVSLSNGQTVTTGGTWGSDAPSVATVGVTDGAVNIVGLGAATIFVDYQGLRATRLVQTTVRYAGRLDGVSRTTRCVATGDWLKGDACSEIPNGSEATFVGTFTQSDRSVTATMSLGEGDIVSPVTAQIDSAGALRLDTTHTGDGLTGTVRWSLRPSGLSEIQGDQVLRFTVEELSGYVEVTAQIVPARISRTASVSARTRAASIRDTLARSVQRLRR